MWLWLNLILIPFQASNNQEVEHQASPKAHDIAASTFVYRHVLHCGADVYTPSLSGARLSLVDGWS
jgi:hypothetical protein